LERIKFELDFLKSENRQANVKKEEDKLKELEAEKKKLEAEFKKAEEEYKKLEDSVKELKKEVEVKRSESANVDQEVKAAKAQASEMDKVRRKEGIFSIKLKLPGNSSN
jgi:predicted nuclease with TOPRIM domain